jgi:hypothetical protein
MAYEQLFPLFPPLQWEMQSCPLPQDFFAEARQWVPEDHEPWLERVMNGDIEQVNQHECAIIADLVDFYRTMRREVNSLREGEGGTRIVPASFLSDHDPLEREEELLRLKWEFLEAGKEPENDWGLRAIYIYLLQLRIVIRRSSFIREAGEFRFNALCQLTPTEVESDRSDGAGQ